MTEQEAWQVVCHPISKPTPRRYLTARMFAVLCAVAIIFGSLWALNH